MTIVIEQPTVPTDASEAFAKMIGLSVISARRYLFRPDFECYEEAIRDEESDGSLELCFSSQEVWHFLPCAEQTSVVIASGPAPRWTGSYFPKDVTSNSFWSDRVGKPISAVTIHKLEGAIEVDASEVAVEFELEDGSKFAVEYISDQHHLESLRVVPAYNSPPAADALTVEP